MGSEREQMPLSAPSVTWDEVGVVRRLRDGCEECVTWAELRTVSVMTTSDGPFADDVFYVLAGEGRNGCVVPSEAVSEAFLARLQGLPGFDNHALIRSMGSTGDAVFVCWRRPTSA